MKFTWVAADGPGAPAGVETTGERWGMGRLMLIVSLLRRARCGMWIAGARIGGDNDKARMVAMIWW